MEQIEIIKKAIKIVNIIKRISDYELTSILVAITPTKLDDIALERLKIALPKLLDVLKKFDEEFNPDAYDFLATHISIVLSDGKLSWHDVKYILKQVYHTTKEG